jgi:hypothetical protein
MLTNCPIDELLSAVEKAYSKFDETKYDLKSPPTKDIIYLLKCILENLMGKVFYICVLLCNDRY